MSGTCKYPNGIVEPNGIHEKSVVVRRRVVEYVTLVTPDLRLLEKLSTWRKKNDPPLNAHKKKMLLRRN